MKLSIITINRNNFQGLKTTIDSVIRQTYVDYEYIIIDGASNDGSVNLIKQVEKNINFWVSEPDKGIYSAMNKGIKHSNSEYCLFLNSGDYLANDNVLNDVFQDFIETDIIYGNLILKKGKMDYRIINYPDNLSFYHFYASVDSLHHQASFIRRSLFNEYGFFREDLKIISDWEFFVRSIILHNCTTKHVGINITVFDLDGISSGLRSTETSLKLEILKELFPPRVLDDYKNLEKMRKSSLMKLKEKLKKNNKLFGLLYMIYTPFLKLKGFLKYLYFK